MIEGFRDEQAKAEEDMKTLAALRMWKRFLVGLRIKERVDMYEIEGEEGIAEPEMAQDDVDEDDAESEETEYIDDFGGGFIVE